MPNTDTVFHLPEIQYGPIDALNRRAAAVGSPVYAQAASHANYNGHSISVSWNDCRNYWVAQYYWAERVVLARGSFESCFAAATREYERGALGCIVRVYVPEGHPDTAAALAICEARENLLPGSESPRDWWTWRHDVAVQSVRDYAHPHALVGPPYNHVLAEACSSEDEYQSRMRG